MRRARRHAALEARVQHPGAGREVSFEICEFQISNHESWKSQAVTSSASTSGRRTRRSPTSTRRRRRRGERPPPVRVFEVPQLVAEGELRALPSLPSFLYFTDEAEDAAPGLRLPWEEQTDGALVGVLAREHGALVPGRQVASAKSWLCHPSVDRTDAILPWGAEAGDKVCSPVEASARYLTHLRDAWNHSKATDVSGRVVDELRFERQQVVLTVPASFDEEARELTVERRVRGGLREPDASRGAARGLLRVDLGAEGWAQASAEGRTARTRLRRRRRHHRLQPDPRPRRGRRGALRADGHRRAPAARRRQRRPRACASRRGEVGRPRLSLRQQNSTAAAMLLGQGAFARRWRGRERAGHGARRRDARSWAARSAPS